MKLVKNIPQFTNIAKRQIKAPAILPLFKAPLSFLQKKLYKLLPKIYTKPIKAARLGL